MLSQPSGLVADLERIAQLDAGRNIQALAAAASGGLNAAARSLLRPDEISVALVTGAYIPFAATPAAETDGPAGAAMLGRGLYAIGAEVRLVTDPACGPVVRSVANAVGLPVEIAGTAEEVETLCTRLRADGITHAVSVERLGPAADGNVYNMRGEPVTKYTAPLHQVFINRPWTTIAIGDGGNELGMGVLSHQLVASQVDHGELIHCAVPADHLIIAGVSNWGATALLLALGLLRPSVLPLVLEIASPHVHERLVRISVDNGGAVDGTTGSSTATIDGIPLDRHAEVIVELATRASDLASRPDAS